jgi:small subunit ribosomal protein S13
MGSGKKSRVKDVDALEKKEEEKKEKEEKKKIVPVVKKVAREIVRVAGTDLDGDKPLVQAIKGIKGISHTIAVAICHAAGLPLNAKLSSFSEADLQKLEQVIKDPARFGVPAYLLNRRRDPTTGKDLHLTGQDVIITQKFDVQKEIDLKTYRGWRHMLGQPVRGQRTRSHFRERGRVVGVMRKAIRIQMAKSGEEKKEK